MWHESRAEGQGNLRADWSVVSFVTVPYVAGPEGRMRPALAVRECVKGTHGEECEVVGHGFRERKTGPEFPIATWHCRRHRCYFTVYPMGQVPYGRVPMAPVDVRGFPPVRPGEGERGRSEEQWRGCVCEAAVDAARDKRWSREGSEIEGKEPGCYGTQRRWLNRCAHLLGLVGAIPQRAAERLRSVLGIDGLAHERLRHGFPAAGQLAERGRSVVAVLVEQPLADDLWWKWLTAGAQGGAWGEARVLEPSVGRLVSPWTLLKSVGHGSP